jgi:hypothetical protein
LIMSVRRIVLLAAFVLGTFVLSALALRATRDGVAQLARALDPLPTVVDEAGGPPPVGGQDSDAAISQQIAQILWNAQQNGQAAGKQDLLPLIEQLQPDLQVTLGESATPGTTPQAVGGVTGLSTVSESRLQGDDSASAKAARVAEIAALFLGVLALGGILWRARRADTGGRWNG